MPPACPCFDGHIGRHLRVSIVIIIIVIFKHHPTLILESLTLPTISLG